MQDALSLTSDGLMIPIEQPAERHVASRAGGGEGRPLLASVLYDHQPYLYTSSMMKEKVCT